MSFHPVSYSTADHPRWGKAHCSPGLLMGHLLGCAERQLQGWAWAGEVGSSWVAGEERPRLIWENFNLSSRLPHLKCRFEMALRLKRKYRAGSRLGIIQHRGLEPNPSSAPRYTATLGKSLDCPVRLFPIHRNVVYVYKPLGY